MQYMFKYLCLLVCLTKCMHKLKFKACKNHIFYRLQLTKYAQQLLTSKILVDVQTLPSIAGDKSLELPTPDERLLTPLPTYYFHFQSFFQTAFNLILTNPCN